MNHPCPSHFLTLNFDPRRITPTDMTLPRPADVSVDEKLAAFDSVPLFMKSLPDDYGNDPAISALQSLAHEGTPDGWFAFVEK